MEVKQIYQLVESEFAAVNEQILAETHSDVPLVHKIGEYIVESGGKRLRPLLVLLAAKAMGYSDPKHLKLAAVIEFLHTATLLHDDVVDTSDMRRGRPTANANWGNAPSVLVGDFMYSRTFTMMVEIGSMDVMDVVARATGVIAEGEVNQLVNVKNPDITEDQYYDVIRGKTATLFEAASWSTAILANQTEDIRMGMKAYGYHLGMAFQLIDDVLDYEGDAAEMGKNVGDDLAEGKVTLPLIHAMREGTEDERKLIRKCIRKGGLEDLQPVLDIIQKTGAIEFTRETAQKQVDLALTGLAALPDSDCKEALTALCNIALTRTK